MKTGEREYWIDSAKGVGILAVMAGHVFSGGVKDIVYLWHMPLFFIVSGILFRGKTPLRQARSIAVNIFYPAFLYFLISVIVFMVPFSDFSLDSFASYYGQGNFVVLWFVFVLAAILLLAATVPGLFRGGASVVLALACLVMGYLNRDFAIVDLPMSLPAVVLAIPFFILGCNFDVFRRVLDLPAAPLLTLICLLPLAIPGLSYDMYRGEQGVPLVSLLLASATCLGIFAALRQAGARMRGLEYLGLNSLVIMCLHQPLHIFLRRQLGMDSEIVLFLTVVAVCALVAHPIARLFRGRPATAAGRN